MKSLLVSIVALFCTVSVQAEELGFSVNTRIVHVSPDGSQAPAAGVRAWLIASKNKPGPHGARAETIGKWTAVTRDDGRLNFVGVKRHRAAAYRVVVPFQGVAYRSEEFSAGGASPTRIELYQVQVIPQNISVKSHWAVDLDETNLLVEQTTRVSNPTLTTMDYTHSPLGLRIPTLSHLIDGRVAAWGLFPKGSIHGKPKPSTGQGRIVSEHGAIVYRGPVLPGDNLFLKLTYYIPYDTERLTVGAISDVPVTDAAVSVRWTSRVFPRVGLSTPHRAVRSSDNALNRADLLHLGGLKVGEPIIVEFDRLPVQAKIPIWMAGSGTVLGVSAFLLLLLGFIMRKRA